LKRRVDWTLVALLLLAALLRFFGLGMRSLWFDEALSGLIGRLSKVQVLANAASSSHPPAYYYMLHMWQPLGASEFALRVPSAWCSLAAVAVVARLGGELFDRRVARVAALGMAIAPFQIYYAQEARMYGLAVLISAGVLWAFWRALRESGWWGWGAYTVLFALGMHVHYFVTLVAAMLHLGLLLDWRRAKRVIAPLLVADLLAVAAFVPQLAQFRAEAGEFLGEARWRVLPSVLEPARTPYYLLFGHVMPLWVVPVGLFLVLGLLAIGGQWLVKRRDRTGATLMMVVVGPPLVGLALSYLVVPVYVHRSFAVATPALMVLLARAVFIVPGRSPTFFLWLGLVFLMAWGALRYTGWDDPAKPPVREAVDWVQSQRQTDDTVLHLQDASYVPALYYAPGAAGDLVDAGQRLWLAPQAYDLFGGHVKAAEELSGGGRVWLITMPAYMDEEQRTFIAGWQTRCAESLVFDRGAVRAVLCEGGGD
jgi:4-amino-4-deoxy-L-arabinose transferase-like glycosyltransferase